MQTRREWLKATLAAWSVTANAPADHADPSDQSAHNRGRGLLILGLGSAGAAAQFKLQAVAPGARYAVIHRREAPWPGVGTAARVVLPLPDDFHRVKCGQVQQMAMALEAAGIEFDGPLPDGAACLIDAAESLAVRLLLPALLATSYRNCYTEIWRLSATPLPPDLLAIMGHDEIRQLIVDRNRVRWSLLRCFERLESLRCELHPAIQTELPT